MLLHALLALPLLATSADTLIPADSAFRLMRRGGYTMIWRHAETDWLTQDAPGSPERAHQRNLTDRGVTDARAIGQLFRHANIPVGEVVSSPMWRTRETAEHAFGAGRVRLDTALRTLEATPAQKAMIAAKPGPGTNRVLVTHHFIIERHVPGVRPGMVNEGEAVIVRNDGDAIRLVAVVKLADWEKATHGTVVAQRTTGPSASPAAAADARPALHGAFQLLKGGFSSLRLLHDDRYVNVMRYLEAYNGGEEAMRNFLERRALADPARPLEQRMEAYRQLRAQLGPLTLDGAELREDDFVLQTRRTTAKDEIVQLTFRFEKAEPYRMAALSFARPQRDPR
jgi:phosphohistidine phosphatase SixA